VCIILDWIQQCYVILFIVTVTLKSQNTELF
jgi:hypothetical protein